jgi:peptide/nickel transport system substrate-binding protein
MQFAHSRFFSRLMRAYTKGGVGDKTILCILACVVFVSGTSFFYTLQSHLLAEIPKNGGEFREGMVGIPRFINPVLATTQVDKDLTSLVFAGLLGRDEFGNLSPRIADTYSVSSDGLSYTFSLKKGVVFHDGTPLTSHDVAYTISRIQDPTVHSPLFSQWNTVRVETPDEYTVVFTLPKPYTPFPERTTVGTLPAHLTEHLSAEEFSLSETTITPIGAGPYTYASIDRDATGIPTAYHLTAFPSFIAGRPFIDSFVCLFYKNTEEASRAFEKGALEGVRITTPPSSSDSKETLVHPTFLRVFGIFFNRNRQPTLLDKNVREALSLITPSKEITDTVLASYGTTRQLPLITSSSSETVFPPLSKEDRERSAHALLEKAGWKRTSDTSFYTKQTKEKQEQVLSISISTVDVPELTITAQKIVRAWRENGIDASLQVFDIADFSQTVLRPRRYEALLFGLQIGHENDIYAFWHSSERNDPGLNLALFVDGTTDTLLEQLRTTQDKTTHKEMEQTIFTRIQEDIPAIGLYTPDFLYLVSPKIHRVSLHDIAEPQERFDTVHTWYRETDRVWPFLARIMSPRAY